MEWHIVTGEYPPCLGGVSDHTYLLATALRDIGESVHIWTPGGPAELCQLAGAQVHQLPNGFGPRWLYALDRGLAARAGRERTLFVQYVPHMYGWKSMNVLFCAWLALRGRKDRLWMMFHEVAFPFRRGQPLRHDLLAVVHRGMAAVVLRGARRSFTTNEPYRALLKRLAPRARVSLLRLFSHVPFDHKPAAGASVEPRRSCAVVGMFSSFNSETFEILDRTLPTLFRDSEFHLRLIGPGERFIEHFSGRWPEYQGRLSTTGRVDSLKAAPYMQECDALLQLYPDGVCASRSTFIAALASGVPVITTAGPLTEVLLLASDGIVYADNDPEAIRTVLDRLLIHKSTARRIGESGKRLYEMHFALDTSITTLTGRRASATEDLVQIAEAT